MSEQEVSELRRRTAGSVAAAFACLGLLAGCAAAHSPLESRDEQTARQALDRHGCTGCHAIPGVGGPESSVGPPLNALGRRVYVGGRLNTHENLVEFIMHPSAVRPSPMPSVGIEREEAVRVARYLVSLR